MPRFVADNQTGSSLQFTKLNFPLQDGNDVHNLPKIINQTDIRWTASTPANGRMELSTRCLGKLVTTSILYIPNTSACCTAPPANPIQFLRLGLDKCKDGIGWGRRDRVDVCSQCSG